MMIENKTEKKKGKMERHKLKCSSSLARKLSVDAVNDNLLSCLFRCMLRWILSLCFGPNVCPDSLLQWTKSFLPWKGDDLENIN